MHYSFIVNPTAGDGYAKEAWRHLRSSIEKLNLSYDAQLTKEAGHATYLAEKMVNSTNELKAANHVVVAVGGDGTVNEVLTGLIQNDGHLPLPLAVIPCGRINNFAHAANINSDIDKALQQIINAKQSQTFFVGHYQDMIKQQEGYFLSSLGIGFDARMNSSFKPAAKRSKRRPSTFAFFRQAMATLYNQQSFSINIDDGKSHQHFERVFIALACNGPYSGSSMLVDPQASLLDPNVDLIVVERKNWLHTVLILWQYLHGRIIKSRFAHYFRANKIHYSIDSLEFRQIDGSDAGNQFADLELNCIQYPFWIS